MRCWIVVLTGCGFSHGSFTGSTPPDDSLVIDGEVHPVVDAPTVVSADAAPDTIGMGSWTNVATVLPGAPVGDDDPTLTGDLLELYFNRNNDIYVTKRASVTAAWGTPTLVNELSSASIETTPEMTSDGLSMFISSDRSPTVGLEDVWFSTRASRSAAWGAPVHINELSSSTDNAASAPTDDLLALVQIGNPSTMDVNLFMSTRTSTANAWGMPAPITSANSTSSDFSPMLSQDKKTLYFDSYRAGGDDLYVATRATASGAFDVPVIISELSTSADESDPWVSPDGHHMFFTRSGVLYEASR